MEKDYDKLKEELLQDYRNSTDSRRDLLYRKFVQQIQELETLNTDSIVYLITHDHTRNEYGNFIVSQVSTRGGYSGSSYTEYSLRYKNELVWYAEGGSNSGYDILTWKPGEWETEILEHLQNNKRVLFLLDLYERNFT